MHACTRFGGNTFLNKKYNLVKRFFYYEKTKLSDLFIIIPDQI